jgi:hypothetical protein
MIVILILIAIALGCSNAYQISTLQIKLREQEDAISSLNLKVENFTQTLSALSGEFSEYRAQDWHLAYHISSSLIKNETWWNEHKDDTFYLHGNEVRIRWHFASVNNSRTDPGQLFITLYYGNGTRCAYSYISSIFSSDSADVDLKEPGLYKVEVHDHSTTWGWLVWIWDYY